MRRFTGGRIAAACGPVTNPGWSLARSGSDKPLSAVDFDALARDKRGQRRDQVENCACTFLGSAEATERDALSKRLEQLGRAEPVVERCLDDTGRDRIHSNLSRRHLLCPSAR